MVVAGGNYATILTRFLEQTDRIGLISVYLFGSHAAGRAHKESDVDIGALLDRSIYPTRKARFEERLRLSSDLMAALGTNVDVVILNDAPPGLAADIVTSGKRLFCAQPAIDRDFVRDIQLRAADLLVFLRRTRRTKLLALQR